MAEITDNQLERYARHVILDMVGEQGQAQLLAARILIVGAGGLGSPLALYLAAAGIGTIGLVDDDQVDLSNLQRQVIHRTCDVGRAKTESAAAAIAALNPDVTIICHPQRLTAENAESLIDAYDLIVDGSDNFQTRYLLNDQCYRSKKPLVAGALLQFEGQLSTFKAYEGPPHPCYRCLFPTPPAAGTLPGCAEAGIFGAVAGVVGTLQATEVLKEILGIGDGLSGRLLVYDALAAETRTFTAPRDPNCVLCGTGA